jgi:glycosyltransferase involved in cell wall biosynthesis
MSGARIVIDARKIADFGIGTYLQGLLGGLAALAPEEEILLLGSSERAPDPVLRDRFEWLREGSPGYSMRELWSVSRALRRSRADLFHAPHYVLPLALPCPAVVTIHDLIHLRFPEERTFPQRVYAHWMIRRAVRTARRILTVSEATAGEIRERFGAPGRPIQVISNGVDDRFRAAAGDEDAQVLRDLGLAPGYLLWVGNLKPHKNFGILLDALARLRATCSEVPPLAIVGPPATPGSVLSKEIAAAGPLPTIHFLGRRPGAELPAIYRQAALLLLPSRWEGFGLPAAEAMAAGTPVVASDRGALPEVIGDAGLRVDADDPEALARAIVAILDDSALRTELGRRGRVRARRFRWDDVARRTLELYREVLAERDGGRT